MTPARTAALAVLGAVGRGRRLDLALAAETRGLPDGERRWVHELAYGVCRLRGRLDHLLDHHVHKGIRRLSPALLDVLRAGAYQLLRMDGVPAYAAVSQSVEQARTVAGRGGASLTNAVLRRVAEAGEDPSLFPHPAGDPAGFLSTWGSHPRWLVDRWMVRWPYEEVAALVEADNAVPPLTVVPLSDTPSRGVERLGEAGIEAREVGHGTGAVEVLAGGSPAEVLARVDAVVQDPGAALVAVYADPPPDVLVADLCAAPGGKAVALAPRARYVLAADRSWPRMRLLGENVSRTQARAGLVVADALSPPLLQADLVLLDAPCTGTGTFRRHPDARWRLAAEDVERLAALQERMLDAAASIVPTGGLLVYATCTLEPEENEQQVARFLGRWPGFTLDPGDAVDAGLLAEGCLSVLPQRTGFDGAFAARLRRTV